MNGQVAWMDTELIFDQPSYYIILVKGRLDPKWAAWFDGLEIHYASENSILQGLVPDQAALHGILTKLNDLGIPLLSLNAFTTDPTRRND